MTSFLVSVSSSWLCFTLFCFVWCLPLNKSDFFLLYLFCSLFILLLLTPWVSGFFLCGNMTYTHCKLKITRVVEMSLDWYHQELYRQSYRKTNKQTLLLFSLCDFTAYRLVASFSYFFPPPSNTQCQYSCSTCMKTIPGLFSIFCTL